MNPGPLFHKKAYLDVIYEMKAVKNLHLHIVYYPLNSQRATGSFRRNLISLLLYFYSVLKEKEKLKYILNCILFLASGYLLVKHK